VKFTNIADLIDQSDPEKRTFRQINNSLSHRIPINALVELATGVRLRVIKQTRDCDGTPLYCLGSDGEIYVTGYCEDSLRMLDQ